MKRGTKPTQVAEHEQRFEAIKSDSWAEALEAFATMLAQPPWAGARRRGALRDRALGRLAQLRARAARARPAAPHQPLRGSGGGLGPEHFGGAAAGDAVGVCGYRGAGCRRAVRLRRAGLRAAFPAASAGGCLRSMAA